MPTISPFAAKVPTLALVIALMAGAAHAQKAPPAGAPEAPAGDTVTDAPAADAPTSNAPTADVPTVGHAGPAQIDFGDDSGAYPRDGECDDRRFAGPGMATFFAWETTGRDATDCQQLMAAGRVTYWDPAASLAATQCSVIDFGTDSGDFPMDFECDDPRFEGRGMANYVQESLIGADATDCRHYCNMGLIGLRNY